MGTPPSQTAAPARPVERTQAGDGVRPGVESSAWIAFAAIVLMINALFGVMFGLAAILNSQVVTVGGGQGVVIWDFTTWGWITLGVSVLMGLTALGLFSGNQAARWAAVFFASVSALVHFGTASAFPLWSLLVIALDVVVIYYLVARWYGPAQT